MYDFRNLSSHGFIPSHWEIHVRGLLNLNGRKIVKNVIWMIANTFFNSSFYNAACLNAHNCPLTTKIIYKYIMFQILLLIVRCFMSILIIWNSIIMIAMGMIKFVSDLFRYVLKLHKCVPGDRKSMTIQKIFCNTWLPVDKRSTWWRTFVLMKLPICRILSLRLRFSTVCSSASPSYCVPML